MEQLVYKNLSEIKDISEGVIVGYANVYNMKDSDGDISLPGSFAKTVTERKKKLRVYKNHDDKILVGVPSDLDISDPYGLKATLKMLMNTDNGRDTFEEVKFLVDNGFESGMSIGSWIVQRNLKNKSEVKEYRLKEISVLTTKEPANGLSLVDTVKAVKDLTEPTQDEFWRLIIKAYDNVGFSDPVLKSLEQFLTLKEKEPDVIDETTSKNEPSQATIIKSIYESIKTI